MYLALDSFPFKMVELVNMSPSSRFLLVDTYDTQLTDDLTQHEKWCADSDFANARG